MKDHKENKLLKLADTATTFTVGAGAAFQSIELKSIANAKKISFVDALKSSSTLNKLSLGLCFAWCTIQLGCLLQPNVVKKTPISLKEENKATRDRTAEFYLMG